MKILVTGANGFIGKNLVCNLNTDKENEIYLVDNKTSEIQLEKYCSDCDFVFYLAGINRPIDVKEYDKNPKDLEKFLKHLIKNDKKPSVLFASSIQAELDNSYGKSKKEAEEILRKYGKEYGFDVLIYRLPNVYGKWCKPNYNSVVATLCYNKARNIKTNLDDLNKELNLVYIDDVIIEFKKALINKGNKIGGFYYVSPIDTVSLGRLDSIIESFKEMPKNFYVPNTYSHLERCLYATYLTYVPVEDLCYSLVTHKDDRGAFVELLKSKYHGQVSINIAHPGITKGNHWHNTKNEKFIVLKGHCLIKLRKIDGNEIITYDVKDSDLKVVDIAPGYTHSIQNIGKEDSITLMWSSEVFDPNNLDTIYLEVE